MGGHWEGSILRFDIFPRPVSLSLRGEAPREGQEQTRRALDPDHPPKDRPHEAAFLPQESKPGLAIGPHMKVGGSQMTGVNLDGLVSNHDCRFLCLGAGEGEVVRGVEPVRLVSLKHEGQVVQEPLDRRGAQPV